MNIVKSHLKHINIQKISKKINIKIKLFITRNTPKQPEILISTFQWFFLYRVEYRNEIFQVFRSKGYEIDHFVENTLKKQLKNSFCF
jgi:hypothetical protein